MAAPPPRVPGDEDSSVEDLSSPTPSSEQASPANSSQQMSTAGSVIEADEDEGVNDYTGHGSEAHDAGGNRDSDGGLVGGKRKRDAESDVDNGRSAPHAGSSSVYDFDEDEDAATRSRDEEARAQAGLQQQRRLQEQQQLEQANMLARSGPGGEVGSSQPPAQHMANLQ